MSLSLTIHSRRLGHPVTFTRPGPSYIYVDLNNQPGTLGLQCCHHGRLRGETITYKGDNPEQFARICRRWWRQYLLGGL